MPINSLLRLPIFPRDVGMTAMADVLRRILYPAFVVTIVGTLWAMGTAQAAADQAYNRRYWPPLNPELYDFAAEPRDPPSVDPVPDSALSLDDEL